MKFKTLIALILGTLLSFGSPLYCSASTSSYSNNVKKIQNIKRQQAQAHAKVKHLRILENIETNKLYKNQKRLESTQNSLKVSQAAYTQKQQQLSVMESNLKQANLEFMALDNELKDRIRQIFKSQRTGFFQLLLTSSDINMLIDRLHFESIVVKEDYKRLQKARVKAAQIIALRSQIEQQKRVLLKQSIVLILNKRRLNLILL